MTLHARIKPDTTHREFLKDGDHPMARFKPHRPGEEEVDYSLIAVLMRR